MTERLEIPPYRSRVNPDILRLIPPDSKSILEIGCGDGSLYTAYQRINPLCTWYGVEKDTEARVAASRIGLRIIGDDAEAFFDDKREWSWNNKNPVDCLIAGDCLEHLTDPWTVLKNAVRCVKPSGQVIASIPNIGHHSVIVSLLKGNWPYADEGLFDRGHLRQFTLSGIRELFAQSGLQIFDVKGRCFGNEHHHEFMKRIQAFGDCVGIDLASLDRQSRVLQYVVRAIKPNWVKIAEPMYREGTVDVLHEIEKLHIHCVLAEPCCSRPRIIEPMSMMETVPGVHYTVGQVPDPASNIIIIQRARGFNLEWYQTWLENRILIAEIDDNPHALEGIPESGFMSLKACHAVECSTERLAKVCRSFNPNVAVFPNMIAELPPPRIYSDVPHPVKIFFGCQNRESDWRPIMGALNNVLFDHPDVQMVVIHDQRFFDALEVSPERATFYPWQDYPAYRSLLRTCDIALLPLEPTPFSLCKSDIGFIEAAAEGVAVLASATVYFEPIYSVGEDCVRGMVYSLAGDFEDNLRILIESPELRHQMAKSAYDYIKRHRMLGQHFREHLAWYHDLLARKVELDQSLMDRVPELRLPS